ncbi:MAG: lysylphosphatidylglycerol synthase transmembrane domain-containing protein [Anaerolineae bacterium]
MTDIHTPPPAKSKNSTSRRLLVILGVLISVIFLAIAFRGLQPQAFLSALNEANMPLLIAAAVVYLVTKPIIAWRWQFLLRALQDVPINPLTRIVIIGYMGNNVYPLRAGEALRLFLLKRNHGVPITGAATTVVIERVFDGIVMLSFVLVALLWVDITSEQVQLVVNIATPIFVIAVLVFFVLALFPSTLRRLIVTVTGLLPESLAQVVIALSDNILVGLGSLRSPLDLFGSVATSYITWAIEAVVYWMVMEAFALDLGYGMALLVVGVVNLAGLIPASPGQVGVYEFFTSAILTAVGIAQNTALAYAIVVHIVIWLPITVVGFVFLLQYGLGWSAISRANELEERAVSPASDSH